ncbi:HK97-gp10 family putative phage morphogenesis protein, partial [Acinetobacter wanghuae]|uniref:HK97-gp10 family putative phage morphogenesis protein n=1 Tax=Acinetobacter wanghuae TaxID=2662362 RepID=UPI003AF6CB9F
FQSKTRQRGGKSFQTSNKDAYYWTWVEFGHVVTTKKIKGGLRAREKARIPLKAAGQFVPARPFMRPALESNKTAAIEAVRVELAKRIAEGLR